MTKSTAPIVEKKFYVLVSYTEESWKKSAAWKKGKVISLPQVEAEPYISARILMPFKTAIITGKYKTTQESGNPILPTPPKPIEESKKPESKKTLVKNSLRDAVQNKKEAIIEPEPEDKPLEEPLEEPTKEPTSKTSSSAAEDAIKKKIAAAKKSKK